MPTELQIIRASDFVRWGGDGHFDLKASRLALAQLAHGCRERAINHALLDLRTFKLRAAPVFSPADLRSLVHTFHEMGFRKAHRLAVLYRADPHHRVRLFASMGKMRGWNVAAFDDLGEAILWLSSDVPKIELPLPKTKTVPVKIKKQPARKKNNRKNS